MKILVLSSSNNNCKHILEELKTNKINYTYKNYNELINNKTIKIQELLYDKILNKKNYHIILYLINKLTQNKLYKYIKNYDLVITTNIFASLTLTNIKKIPFIYIELNYNNKPFIKIKPNYYISINNIGIPISSNYIKNKKNIRYNLNINKEQTILLIIENIDNNIINQLLTINNIKLIIITKLNKNLIKNKKVIILNNVHNLNDLIYSVDIVITNPNGLLSTEIFVINKPLIHIFPQSKLEQINLNYFKENNLSLYCNDINNIKKYVLELLNNNNLKNKLINNQKKLINQNTGYDFINIINSIKTDKF